MKRTEIDILGICEHRWSGQGHFKMLTGGMYIYSGKQKEGENNIGHSGVGFYLSNATSKSLLGYNPISYCLLTIRLKGNVKNISIMQIYAPTSAADDEELEHFHNLTRNLG